VSRPEGHADCDREDVRLELALEPVRRHESPDVLVARRRDAELAGTGDERPSDLGVRLPRARELLELGDKAWMKTGSR
jgi:hypothetical protein